MTRRPSLPENHVYYHLDTTHYVIRIGSKFTVDYPLPNGYAQEEKQAVMAFIRMVESFNVDPRSKAEDITDEFHVTLVRRKAGTRRASGRMRFYQQEILRWGNQSKGLEYLDI